MRSSFAAQTKIFFMSTVKPLPAFFVGKSITNTRKTNYETDKLGILTTALGKGDTKNIWYTRNHIADLLDEIDSAGGDGLRIYFGAYEEGHDFEGQLCLVMNVTREGMKNNVTTHENVYLEDEPDYEDRLNAERDAGINSPIPGGKRDFNFGSPCPPRCDL
jgi:hypothetical protein